MIKTICINGKWFVPNITGIKTWAVNSTDYTVFVQHLYTGMDESAITYIDHAEVSCSNFDATAKKYWGITTVRNCQFYDNPVWLSYDVHSYGDKYWTYYFKLDDVLANKNNELILGGVKAPLNPPIFLSFLIKGVTA